MKKKIMFFLYIILSTAITNILMVYIYPAKKPSSRYTFTVNKDRKITDGTNILQTIENCHDYNECITVCFNNINKCKSIDVEKAANSSFTCRLFKIDSPATQLAEGFLFIIAKPPSCSLSCEATLNLCGTCDCNPSCASRNRRQYICNCTEAAGIAKSCQEHYDHGFNKTGIYQIRPNSLQFETVCEMKKVERQNPTVNQLCIIENGVLLSYYNYYGTNTYSTAYCVKSCAKKNFIIMFYYYSGCFCGYYHYTDSYNSSYTYNDLYTRNSYCQIGPASTDCSLTGVSYNQRIVYTNHMHIYSDPNICVEFCKAYQTATPTIKGYVSSGIGESNGNCKCLYGIYGSPTRFDYGCAYFVKIPTLSTNIGVWIPMMTRFSSWESSIWDKSYEAYENGFGLVNQQWIGLKNLNQITSTFLTDMRVNYIFNEEIVFSVLYTNVSVGSSVDNYIFNYGGYDPQGTGEKDRFQANGKSFSRCNKWWTENSCSNNFPTSVNDISFGLNKNLVSIQFYLKTKQIKG